MQTNTTQSLTDAKPTGRRRLMLASSAVALAVTGAVATYGLLPPPGAANAQPVAIEQPSQVPSFADVVEQVSPAVVAIRVRGERRAMIEIPGFEDLPEGSPEERFFDMIPELQDPVPTTSLGSGFFVSDDGYIVTNNHVVDDAQSFTVILNDGEEYQARLIGTDPLTDLALLKIDAEREFTYVAFSDDPIRIGDWALAVGNPFGLGGTVTAGIVSASGRQLGNSAYDDFIQIDAAVNRGNSGGPTFNLAGEVIGVNTAIFSPSGGNVGIAFAVPASTAADVIADLRDDGSVERGWLGVRIQTVTADIAEALGLDQPGGAIIADPIDGGPADRAGVQTRDIVTAVNGDPIDDSTDLAQTIGGLDPATEATLTIVRDGEEMELVVELGAMPNDQEVASSPQTEESPDQAGLGLQLSENRDGEVIVFAVDPDGTAAAAGLRQGDVILGVDDQPVESFEDVRDAVDAAEEGDRDVLLFQIRRNNAEVFVAVRTTPVEE